MKFWLWILAIAIGEVLGLFVANVLADEHKVTLHGTLFTNGDGDCRFFLDPTDDSESVGLDATSGNYLCDYLLGSNAKPFTVILQPGK